MLEKLTYSDELSFTKDLLKKEPQTYRLLYGAFSVIQTRAQILLSLGTVCLTIAGLSGPKIVVAGPVSKCLFGASVCLVLTSILCLLWAGPLRIKWMTQYRSSSLDSTLVELLKRRDKRTRQFNRSIVFLTLGLIAFTGSLIMYAYKADSSSSVDRRLDSIERQLSQIVEAKP